jgi:hypothetical protein
MSFEGRIFVAFVADVRWRVGWEGKEGSKEVGSR